MVDESEYRSTYQSVNQRRCKFEKAVLTRRSLCALSSRFYLADREGISCDSQPGQECCHQFLQLLRENARFALKLTETDTPLPHAKEIKIQRGGVLGLQKTLHPELGDTDKIDDISNLLALAKRVYGSLEELPYQEIMKAVVHFQGRARPKSKR